MLVNRVDRIIARACELFTAETGLLLRCVPTEETLKQRFSVEVERTPQNAVFGEIASDQPLAQEKLSELDRRELALVSVFPNNAKEELSKENKACLQVVSAELRRCFSLWLRMYEGVQELETIRSHSLAIDGQLKTLQLFYDLEKSYANTLEAEAFLQLISQKLSMVTQADQVLIVKQENDQPPIAFQLDQRHGQLTKVPAKPMFQKKSFAIRIKSGFSIDDLSIMVDKNVVNHLGVPFHSLQELHGESFDIWGRVELINHPQNFREQDLNYLNVVVDKVTAAFMRERMFERKTSKERLATIGQLSSSIIHDFRNPMTSIRGFAELIKINGDSIEEEQRSKICTIIMNQVDRCTNMIEELLSFARGDKKYNFEHCNIDGFLSDMIDLIRVETDKNGIVLEYDLLCNINAQIDRDKMMRVLLNLTNNAIEILEEGEKLIISSRATSDKNVEIRVADTGPGVPKSLKASLFEAFVTQGKESGTGLGLHISKDIVEAHQGQLLLDETYKAGACFVLRFPQQVLIAPQAG